MTEASVTRHSLRCQACGSFIPAAGAHSCKPKAQQRPAPAVKFWTPDRTARLEELAAAGMPRGEIAVDLSCSREAVKSKLRRLSAGRSLTEPNPKPQPPVVPFAGGSAFWSDDRIAWMTDAYTAGASTGKIARELGCTRNSVIGKLHRLGIYRPLGTPPKPRPPKPPAPPPAPAAPNGQNAPTALPTVVAGTSSAYRTQRDAGLRYRMTEHRGGAKVAAAIVNRVDEASISALPAANDAPQPIPPTAVSIFELTGMTCRWPLWGMEITPVSEQFYCGAESVMPCRYCHSHSQIAFSRGR